MDERAAKVTMRQRVKRLLLALLPAKEIDVPKFDTTEWHRWVCGDVTRLCGHGYHQGGEGIVCDGTIVEGIARASCRCDCHAAPLALCTCGEPGVALVTITGLLCDEPGTVRTYTFCDPCARQVLSIYRGAEMIGSVQ